MAPELDKPAGAAFWVYVSPQYDTAQVVTEWTVTISQGDWSGVIASATPPAERHLQTPGLSGVFAVKVTGSGPNLPETTLPPMSRSKPDVGCSADCAAMIGITAVAGGGGGQYWTVWDAMRNPT